MVPFSSVEILLLNSEKSAGMLMTFLTETIADSSPLESAAKTAPNAVLPTVTAAARNAVPSFLLFCS